MEHTEIRCFSVNRDDHHISMHERNHMTGKMWFHRINGLRHYCTSSFVDLKMSLVTYAECQLQYRLGNCLGIDIAPHENGEPEKSSITRDIPGNTQSSSIFMELQEADNISKAAYKELMSHDNCCGSKDLGCIYSCTSWHNTKLLYALQWDPDSGSWRKIHIEPTFPIYLKFEEVKYKIVAKGEKNHTEKCILQGITGSVHPGEVLALMGP
ncbi:hypothetical protein F0562_006535 [Nyssa sinensis]|uniref:Uncharacterized protein n=1 Tax=Nyssa sinensis TaxID=561372 RepID=A0A5J5ANF4_9ASTE|nr:hypothetical protein F0562_006535 [Nyssa sinensis]